MERVSLPARFCKRGSQWNFHKFLHKRRGDNPLEEKEGDQSRSILRVVHFSSAWIGWIWTSSPLQLEPGKFKQRRTWLILLSDWASKILQFSEIGFFIRYLALQLLIFVFPVRLFSACVREDRCHTFQYDLWIHIRVWEPQTDRIKHLGNLTYHSTTTFFRFVLNPSSFLISVLQTEERCVTVIAGTRDCHIPAWTQELPSWNWRWGRKILKEHLSLSCEPNEYFTDMMQYKGFKTCCLDQTSTHIRSYTS